MKLKMILFFLSASSISLNAAETTEVPQEVANRTQAQIHLVLKNIATLRKTRACPGCYLVGARLAGMDLQRVDLTRAIMLGVQAPGASFNLADLTGANCTVGNFKGADFTGAKLPRKEFFAGADLTDTILKKREPKKSSAYVDSDDD